NAVLGEVDRPDGVRLEYLDPIRVRDRVRAAGGSPQDADADAAEDDLITRDHHAAVREGALELVVQHGLDGPDGDRADHSGIEELDGEVVGKGDRTGRVGDGEGRVAHEVHALLQSKAV